VPNTPKPVLVELTLPYIAVGVVVYTGVPIFPVTAAAAPVVLVLLPVIAAEPAVVFVVVPKTAAPVPVVLVLFPNTPIVLAVAVYP
jgi:hypothetical protein